MVKLEAAGRSEAKPHGYRVRITPQMVMVEHRAAFRPRTLLLLGLLYVAYCMLPAIRWVIQGFWQTGDLVYACFLVVFLLIPVASGFTWLLFASGEVMRCDGRELRFAARRTFGRWHRHRFDSALVESMQSEWRGGPKQRTYTVIAFHVDGKRYQMLEDLPTEDMRRVLCACRAMGLDAICPMDHPDPAVAMNLDIEKRGWFVKPWKSD